MLPQTATGDRLVVIETAPIRNFFEVVIEKRQMSER